MALLLLIAIGAIIGWLATIVTHTEDARGVLTGIGVGAVASAAAGLFVNKGSIIGGLSALALAVGLVAAIVALIALHLVQNHGTDAGQ